MKNIFFAILICIVTGCGEKEDSKPQEMLELNAASLIFNAESGFQCIGVSSNDGWTATGDADWIECEPAQGKGSHECVKIKTLENTTGSERTCNVSFKTGSEPYKVVEVTQERPEQYITIQPLSYEAPAAGGEIRIEVSANSAWELNIPAEAQDWLVVESTSESKVLLILNPNDSETDRSCELVFSIPHSPVIVPFTLIQKSNTIELEPSSKSVSSNQGEFTITVNSGLEWTVNIPGQVDWLSLKTKTENEAVFSVQENSVNTGRSAEISFVSLDGELESILVLTQEKGYTLTCALLPDQSLLGKGYGDIHSHMQTYGFNYSEHPNCSGGYGEHIDGVHISVEMDPLLNQYVYKFDVHINPVIDGDRCSSGTVDRQRNEMKSETNNTTWANIQGNWDEWQVLEWKFKLPKGFQPTSSFCHIHQLKAQDGPHNGSPMITITPRANSDGSNKRIQIIHSVDGDDTGKGRIVDNIPLSQFEGEWVQVRQEAHYTHNGFYACKITRMSDNKVLVDYKDENIDMWRKGSSFIRSKYGIYRSLAGGKLNQDPVGQSPLLKNESIWITDIKVYEKNTNPNPEQPHD